MATKDKDTEAFVADILHGGKRGFGPSILRALLWLLSLLYRGGLAGYLALYRVGILRRTTLPVPVVAIGNLTSGGTGKTPTTTLVATHLRDMGKRVVVLSRGHGREGERRAPPLVVSDGVMVLAAPDQAGDEPVLLAHLLPGVPVVVGKDRRVSGRFAIKQFKPDTLVLDDGLQFWQLATTVNIILLDTARPFDNGHVLPRGLLREPKGHLARAHIVLLTRSDRTDDATRADTLAHAQRLAPGATVLTATHQPIGWRAGTSDALLPLSAVRGFGPCVLFSGIADGESFAQAVAQMGADIAHRRDFGDHHAYTSEEVAALTALPGVAAALTTEKDWVKVAPLWATLPDPPPLYALHIQMAVSGEDTLWHRLAMAILSPV